MLSRVADAMLWMSRYIERAEHAARVVDVNINLLLDAGIHPEQDPQRYWEPLIGGTEERTLFYELYEHADEQTVPEFFTFQAKNPNAILSTVSRARENARTIRESISSEMWEHLNLTYWAVQSASSRRLWDEGPHSFYQQVKEASHAFQGITDATMLRGEEWSFIQLGKHLERADNTSRLLDIRAHMLSGPGEWAEHLDAAQWMAVLKSCSAFEAYRRFYVARIEPRRVIEFLVYSDSFPRSMRFSVSCAAEALSEIGTEVRTQEARRVERSLGQLRSELDYGSVEDLLRVGMHHYLDGLQAQLNRVNDELYAAYLVHHAVPSRGLTALAQQEQQQQ